MSRLPVFEDTAWDCTRHGRLSCPPVLETAFASIIDEDTATDSYALLYRFVRDY